MPNNTYLCLIKNKNVILLQENFLVFLERTLAVLLNIWSKLKKNTQQNLVHPSGYSNIIKNNMIKKIQPGEKKDLVDPNKISLQ